MKTNADLPRSPAVQRAVPFSGILPVDDVHMIDSSKVAGRSNVVDGSARAGVHCHSRFNNSHCGLSAGPCVGLRQEDTAMIQTQKASPRATVLVVDDDVAVAEAISQCLILEAGYEVAVAHDGLEALLYCLDWRPRCIVTDLIMPSMNGYQDSDLTPRRSA